MKRLVALLLALLLMCSCALADFENEELEFDFQGISVLEEWEGETSDTNKWLLLRGTLTNWSRKSLKIEDNLSATLTFRDKYVFEAVPTFGYAAIDPLVELDGGLLFYVPNMVVTSDAEMLSIVVELCGEEREISLDKSMQWFERSDASLEGMGFDSPEEAVEAYVIAFNNGDAASMLSTFAIETYVDNFDTQKFIERIRAVSLEDSLFLPSANDYIRGIQIAYRYGSLAKNLFYQYLQYNTPEEYADLANGYRIFLNEDGAAEAFVNAMSDVPMEKWLGKIELTRFLSVEELAEIIHNDQLSENYYNESNQNNIQRVADYYGCDELVDVPVLLKIDGTDYLLFMQCVRYGDTWYNLSLGRNVYALSGIGTFMGGLIPLKNLIEENQ